MSACVLCDACRELKQGATPEIVVCHAMLYGVSVGETECCRLALCPEHDLLRAMITSAMDDIVASEGAAPS